MCNGRRRSCSIFASGGLRTGVDIAKCIALGARLGGMAGPFLKAAAQSLEDTVQTIEELKREIQVCMFAGWRQATWKQLTPTELVVWITRTYSKETENLMSLQELSDSHAAGDRGRSYSRRSSRPASPDWRIW